ncbi:MAG: chorismate lyase [Deltaproteobacteria bacterium]|nr:chorismate lyase [Deltaproteobacteria bacterium]
MLYNITISGKWMDGSEFLSVCSSEFLDAPTRMLLLSDGSLTLLLNASLLSSVGLQRLRQEEVNLDRDMAEYIEAEAGQTATDRDVWLMNGAKRVVYANSILPTSLMRDDIYNEIARGNTPIGTLLSEQSILTRRDRLQIGRIMSVAICRELGLPDATLLWARRYRLHAEVGFKGALIEVFSPKIFEGTHGKGKDQGLT